MHHQNKVKIILEHTRKVKIRLTPRQSNSEPFLATESSPDYLFRFSLMEINNLGSNLLGLVYMRYICGTLDSMTRIFGKIRLFE